MMKKYAAYVMQDDLFFSFLTVTEILAFVSALRLPHASPEIRKLRVEEIIDEMGLRKCKDTAVGSHGKKGISGGERKRLSVGCELLSDPRLLFLDEPTSGLDSSTAYSIIHILKTKNTRTTILCTIHQPSAKIFELFDLLMVLSAGNIVFFGSCQTGLDYYAKQGFACPPLYNPADHFLDVISADPTNHEAMQKASSNAKKLVDSYHTIAIPVPDVNEDEADDLPVVKHPGKITQFRECLQRSARNFYRDKQFICSQLIQNIFIGIFIGLVFLNLPLDQYGIDRRFSVSYFIAINQGAFAVYAVLTSFPTERDIILRERAAGSYGVLPYFLGKSLAEIPLQILYPTIFTAIVYPMIGFRSDFYAFANFWIILELSNMCAISLGLAASAFSPTVAFATIITPLVIEMCRLYSGYYNHPVALPGGLIWIQYLSFLNYSFAGLAINEIKPLEFFCTDEQLIGGVCEIETGKEALDHFQMIDLDVYQCQLVLIGMILFFRCLAYFFVLKNKRGAS